MQWDTSRRGGIEVATKPSYRVAPILKQILAVLEKEKRLTPQHIARRLAVHPQTIGRYIRVGEELHIIHTQRVIGTPIKICEIHHDYEKAWENIKKEEDG